MTSVLLGLERDQLTCQKLSADFPRAPAAALRRAQAAAVGLLDRIADGLASF